VFELIGATSACALAYILPPLCFLKLRSKRDWQTGLAWGTVGFGTCVLTVSIVLAVLKIVKRKSSCQDMTDYMC
jgi:solute carrier family 38 (sodium-coupled neutral amino acid transporter), member 11